MILLGQGAPELNTIGSFDVKELFVEARMPLVQDKTGAQDLALEAGYRYSDYSLGFNTDARTVRSQLRACRRRPLPWQLPERQYARRMRRNCSCRTVLQLDGNSDPCAGGDIDPGTGIVTGGASAAQMCSFGSNGGSSTAPFWENPLSAIQRPGRRQSRPRSGGVGHVFLRVRAHADVPVALQLVSGLL
mgnify:CR=1 FL=1